MLCPVNNCFDQLTNVSKKILGNVKGSQALAEKDLKVAHAIFKLEQPVRARKGGEFGGPCFTVMAARYPALATRG